MSVTFTLRTNQLIDVENKDFNPGEKEDPFYNPRTMKEFIYPALNVSNINFVTLFEELNLKQYGAGNTPYYGIIPKESVEPFIFELNKYKAASLARKSLDFVDDVEVYVNHRIPLIDKISRFALALGDEIFWG